jgi:hypothetical protein
MWFESTVSNMYVHNRDRSSYGWVIVVAIALFLGLVFHIRVKGNASEARCVWQWEQMYAPKTYKLARKAGEVCDCRRQYGVERIDSMYTEWTNNR